MAYISKQLIDELVLPDGSVASSVYDIQQYLKQNKLAMASDYSGDFRKQVRYKIEKEQRKELFDEFMKNYKKQIWYEMPKQFKKDI